MRISDISDKDGPQLQRLIKQIVDVMGDYSGDRTRIRVRKIRPGRGGAVEAMFEIAGIRFDDPQIDVEHMMGQILTKTIGGRVHFVPHSEESALSLIKGWRIGPYFMDVQEKDDGGSVWIYMASEIMRAFRGGGFHEVN